MTSCFRTAAAFVAVSLPLLSGCFTSYITAPHQPYAPLLDHAGQLDVSFRGGGITTNNMSVAVQAAYAPIDHLEVAVSLDGDFDRTEENRTLHGGGGIAIGTFTRTDTLRVEALAGVNGGYAEGYGTQCVQNAMGCMSEDFDLTGLYVQPFVQAAVGFEIPYFELAGGARIEGHFVQVEALGEEGTRQSVTHERVLFSPFLTVRVPVDVVRFEFMTGLPIALTGADGPLEGTYEPDAYWYFVGGVAVQIDTAGPAPVEEAPPYRPVVQPLPPPPPAAPVPPPPGAEPSAAEPLAPPPPATPEPPPTPSVY